MAQGTMEVHPIQSKSFTKPRMAPNSNLTHRVLAHAAGVGDAPEGKLLQLHQKILTFCCRSTHNLQKALNDDDKQSIFIQTVPIFREITCCRRS